MGTRWSAGSPAPAGLSASFQTAVSTVEADLPPDEIGQARWTLTWLEGRPVAELDLGVVVSEDAEGTVTVEHDDA